MATLYAFICVLLSSPTTVSAGSHSFWMLTTYIKGATPRPELSVTFMLDDVTVGHYNSEIRTYIPRGNTTNEDEMTSRISAEMQEDFHPYLDNNMIFENKTESQVVFQLMTLCELSDNDKPGKIIAKIAVGGSTKEEVQLLDSKFTHQSTQQLTKVHQEVRKFMLETIVYQRCLNRHKYFLEKRGTQVKKKVKPRVRLFQKANPDSGGFVVSCLATGFYPRHINLTLLRDGQPVPDHEVTVGDLLPNGDGMYQMRKSLEIRVEERDKHKYTCSATHLSLDNKLNVTLDFDPGEPFESVIPSVLIILALVLLLIAGAVIYKCRKRQAASSKRDCSSSSTSDECTGAILTHESQQEATETSETLSA